MKRAFITGITGQVGSYLAELLLSKDYEVHGLIRRSSQFNTGRIDHIFDKLTLHHGDLLDPISIAAAIRKVRPDEIYHLAAQSHVGISFYEPIYTRATIVDGTANVMDAALAFAPKARIYNAATSEMFGDSPPPQCETTPFSPLSPYAVAKVHAFHDCVMRRKMGQWITNGILFNTESPRRGPTFVTQKIIQALVRRKPVTLGNVYAERDWGLSSEYVVAQWLMLQQDDPTDTCISTEQRHSVMDFAVAVCARLDLDPDKYILIDDKYRRPLDTPALQGDVSKARRELKWEAKTKFEDLIQIMVDGALRSDGFPRLGPR